MYLPRINAVSEGLTSIALLSVFTAFLGGKAFWLSSPLGIRNNEILLLLPLITFVGNLYANCKNILAKTSIRSLMSSTKFMASLTAVTLLNYCQNIEQDFGYIYIYVATYSKVTIACQLSHAAGLQYQPDRLVNTAVVYGMLVNAMFKMFSREIYWLKVLLEIVAFLDFFNFIYHLVMKTASLLRISVFSVPPRRYSQN